MEAVKQGSATVGVKSKTHAVLVALKRASSELSAYQKKIMNLDDHMGMSIAGITWWKFFVFFSPKNMKKDIGFDHFKLLMIAF